VVVAANIGCGWRTPRRPCTPWPRAGLLRFTSEPDPACVTGTVPAMSSPSPSASAAVAACGTSSSGELTDAAPGAPPRVRRRGGVVRLIGRLPLQGRHGTLQLVRLCHDGVSPQDLRHARSRLRHAVAMNILRHVGPLPAGALAVHGWVTLARHLPVSFARIAWAAATVTALLETAGMLAAYAQASIHLTLARRLRTRIGATPPPGGDNNRAALRPPEEVAIVPRRDRVATRALVGAALCLVPPGVAIEGSVLVGWWTV